MVNSIKKNVLIIDDSAEFLDLMKEFFERVEHLYNLYTCINCDEALELVKDVKIDLAFIDINLQIMSGVDCLKKLREISSNIPSYLMSGYIVDEESDTFKNLDILGILKKPFLLFEFLSIVMNYLGGENSHED